MREFGWKQGIAWIAVVVGIVLLGACGFVGASVGSHLYADHQLIDQAREANVQQLRQAAEQVKQYQQQQAGQAAPASPAPAAPAK